MGAASEMLIQIAREMTENGCTWDFFGQISFTMHHSDLDGAIGVVLMCILTF
jgi:hypothetical protein